MPTFSMQSPFERMRVLLDGIAPGAEPIDLSVGGPRHPMPEFVAEVLTGAVEGFGRYPPIAGTPAFQDAVHGWFARRYGLGDFLREHGAVLPLNGSREGLFFAAISARDLLGKPGRPAILFANPFYQAYPAAAHAIGADLVPLAPRAPDSVLPDWESVPKDVLDRAICFYVASPANPQGVTASMADWRELFERAARHDFFLFADECYSELYRERAGPPVGALECAKAGAGLDRLVAFNSLSKRSNLPGLRCGFLAAGRAFAAHAREFRNQAAPQVPEPVQAVAVAALADEAHVAASRALYDEKFRDGEAILGDFFASLTPPAGFFLWLDVGRFGDDVTLVRRLWQEAGIRAVPGSYLALTDDGGMNPGTNRVRFALVAEPETTRTAFGRIRDVLAGTPARGAP